MKPVVQIDRDIVGTLKSSEGQFAVQRNGQLLFLNVGDAIRWNDTVLSNGGNATVELPARSSTQTTTLLQLSDGGMAVITRAQGIASDSIVVNAINDGVQLFDTAQTVENSVPSLADSSNLTFDGLMSGLNSNIGTTGTLAAVATGVGLVAYGNSNSGESASSSPTSMPDSTNPQNQTNPNPDTTTNPTPPMSSPVGLNLPIPTNGTGLTLPLSEDPNALSILGLASNQGISTTQLPGGLIHQVLDSLNIFKP